MFELFALIGISFFAIYKLNKSPDKEDRNNQMIKTNKLAEELKIKTEVLYKIMESIGWVEKSDKRGWKVTEAGSTRGGKQNNFRGTEYVSWNIEIKDNPILENAIKDTVEIKKSTPERKPQRMTNKEKKDKGDMYEEYIAKYFRDKGYYVLEHGKEKGVEDGGIDLFVKKDKVVYFVQCKHWEKSKIDDKTIKATQTDVFNYQTKNPLLNELLKDYETKIMYVISKECLTKGAYTYIQENKEIIEYQVIEVK